MSEVGVREHACGSTRPTGGRGRGPRGARSRAVYRADENVEGVQEAQGGGLGKGPRKNTCPHFIYRMLTYRRE